MTREEYRRICERIARKAIRYAEQMSKNVSPDGVTSEREHWIDVYLDEHLPDVDADALLEVTTRGGTFEETAGRKAPSREVAARHALQADVWDAIDQTGGAP